MKVRLETLMDKLDQICQTAYDNNCHPYISGGIISFVKRRKKKAVEATLSAIIADTKCPQSINLKEFDYGM